MAHSSDEKGASCLPLLLHHRGFFADLDAVDFPPTELLDVWPTLGSFGRDETPFGFGVRLKPGEECFNSPSFGKEERLWLYCDRSASLGGPLLREFA